MSRFISIEAIPVHLEDDPQNVIYIKPKMDYATITRVRSAVVSASGGSMNSLRLSLDLVAANLALLVNNIVRWSGPDFDNMPCNAENIGRIDPDDPLLDKVLAEINDRNPQEIEAELIQREWEERLDAYHRADQGGRKSPNFPPVNKWDDYIALTERYHWTDYEIDALDPDYKESLMAFIVARNNIERKHRPKPRKG